ncbi:MAG: hypothetical protein E5V72_14825 [Mesorhizobium sp.]|uniref:ATP-dependent DNA ligase n=1 Tax=Mesorhizobium sp. TaxID=1871066 RepID=UPI000FE41EDE|nr:hypothetical protein [Mesorhizobium sp.]RWH49579.1 MAG: hypothetical protein EOQ80_06640 [Mesorhizobium sp.]RWI74815.1 MAG: hypothetical protein EOR19_20235 [Mesorhizobium sp.]RWJ10549.1 MAG: hypothetical protein EOR24_14795 [Mesorhizobium sp.]RWJ17821.1 MAG: hypothetical protein EOR25_10670 [Mesorhizobium sp.]RWJ33308.1 MAG: hypothetical protein EOR28_12030 [Mesorhizobium sp.]
MIASDTIYKLDTQGRLRSWRYEVDSNRWRSISGIVDGAQTATDWTVCYAKSQETNEAQAQFEAEAERRKKLERQYHPSPDTCDTPNFFEPMLAKGYKGKIQFPIASQPKLDGIRCIARAEGLFTRQGKPIVSCPHIEEELAPFFVADPDLVLDGELYNHALKADFEQIVSLVRKQEPNPATAGVVQYHIYDIPSFDGTFFQRAPVYNAMLKGSTHLVPVETRIAFNQAMFDKDYEEFLGDGYEGQMGRLDADYEIGKRSAYLLKRKEFQDAEFPITAIGEGLGNWSGHAKYVEFMLPDDARLENGERPRAGIKGTKEFCKKLLEEAEEWVCGKSTSTIQFFQLSARGIPRFPVATKFHKAGVRM